MDLRKLKKLIDLVEESGIAELEVTEGEEKVRITRNVQNTAQYMQPMQYHVPQQAFDFITKKPGLFVCFYRYIPQL